MDVSAVAAAAVGDSCGDGDRERPALRSEPANVEPAAVAEVGSHCSSANKELELEPKPVMSPLRLSSTSMSARNVERPRRRALLNVGYTRPGRDYLASPSASYTFFPSHRAED